VARGQDRLACVQVWFTGGERCRTYDIFHRPARSNGKARKEGRWWVGSDAWEKGHLVAARVATAAAPLGTGEEVIVEAPPPADLRDRDQARQVEEHLANLPQDIIEHWLGKGKELP
jgi:hypothetical protein